MNKVWEPVRGRQIADEEVKGWGGLRSSSPAHAATDHPLQINVPIHAYCSGKGTVLLLEGHSTKMAHTRVSRGCFKMCFFWHVPFSNPWAGHLFPIFPAESLTCEAGDTGVPLAGASGMKPCWAGLLCTSISGSRKHPDLWLNESLPPHIRLKRALYLVYPPALFIT